MIRPPTTTSALPKERKEGTLFLVNSLVTRCLLAKILFFVLFLLFFLFLLARHTFAPENGEGKKLFSLLAQGPLMMSRPHRCIQFLLSPTLSHDQFSKPKTHRSEGGIFPFVPSSSEDISCRLHTRNSPCSSFPLRVKAPKLGMANSIGGSSKVWLLQEEDAPRFLPCVIYVGAFVPLCEKKAS